MEDINEALTVDFARSVLEIPTPQVYAWSAHANNSVGSEYIVMEEAPGTKLGIYGMGFLSKKG
ncbi:hypothetical protein VTN77DRAFT_623 [Rasamsonia byssochlamydoides]|uniref:uncharacterized protein n=1 Tax=Rasamsonia byssochlamydoides TaxID=89139 RepID=UPI0037432E44